MPETSGIIVIKEFQNMFSAFKERENKDALDVVKSLGITADLDLNNLDLVCAVIEDVEKKSDYIKYEIYGQDWVTICEKFVKEGKNIKWYARLTNDWGEAYFYSLNDTGYRFYCKFDVGGDLCALEKYVDEAKNSIAKWKASLPEVAISAFTDLEYTDHIDFDDP